MNMNRGAVDTALGLAGNMPMKDEDKIYRNLVYVFCKNLYLPTLFNSLCEIDWRCARKDAPLIETSRYVYREGGKFYYELPADCVRPLSVDGNSTDFYNDAGLIITDYPAAALYYVFHKRKFDFSMRSPDTHAGRDGAVIIRRPVSAFAERDPAVLYSRAGGDSAPGDEEDFPEWEYTDYDTDFWTYFSYRLAAALVPKLRSDDGSGARVQSLEALARQKGEEAIQRSKAGAANAQKKNQTWIEKLGLEGGNPAARERTPYRWAR
jgi:hypothetical protein